MHPEEFQESVSRLVTEITATIESFFQGETFDRTTMGEFSSQDVEQLAIDAHMFGAGIYVN